MSSNPVSESKSPARARSANREENWRPPSSERLSPRSVLNWLLSTSAPEKSVGKWVSLSPQRALNATSVFVSGTSASRADAVWFRYWLLYGYTPSLENRESPADQRA